MKLKKFIFLLLIIINYTNLLGYTCRVSNSTDNPIYISFDIKGNPCGEQGGKPNDPNWTKGVVLNPWTCGGGRFDIYMNTNKNVDAYLLPAKKCMSFTLPALAYTIGAFKETDYFYKIATISRYIGTQNRSVIMYQLPNSQDLHLYDY